MELVEKDVARLGMGCWGIGGGFFAGEQPLGFPDIDDGAAVQVLHAAFDAGIRIFDTAGVYGAGRSERLLGRAFKGREEVLIISKLGMIFDERTRQVAAGQIGPADVGAAIDESLRRLQRDCVDIMLLHLNSLPPTEARPVFEAMARAREGGKIRAYGWSTDFPASVTAMAAMPGFAAVEHAMNVFIDAPKMQSVARQHHLAALIRSPLAMGLLTGKFNGSTVVAGDDVRSVNSDRRDYFRNGKASPGYLAKLDALRDLLRTNGRTLAQGALGWLLAKSETNIPLPGARSVAQATENAAAIELGPLPDDVMDAIEATLARAPECEPRAR